MFNHTHNNHCCYFFTNTHGRIVHASEALRQLIGHAYAALEGSPIDTLLEHQQSSQGSFFNTMRTQGEIINHHIRLKQSNHNTTDAYITLCQVTDDQGNICGYEGHIVPDVESTSSLLQQVKDNHPMPIIRLSQDGIVIYANQASRNLLTILGGALGKKLHAQWQDKVAHVFQSKTSMLIHATSPQESYHCLFVAQHDELLIHNVPPSAQQKQYQPSDNALKSTLESTPESKSNQDPISMVTRGIAHDFNNMLSVVIANASMIRKFSEDLSGTELRIKRILKAAQSASYLCDSLLTSDQDKAAASQPVFIADIFKYAESMLENLIDNKKVQLFFYNSPDTPPIQGHQQHIQRIILNLVLNANESMQDSHGQILISGDIMEVTQDYINQCHGFHQAKTGAYVYFEVEDNGCGMNQDTLQDLFTPFHTSKKTGHGLGMCTILDITQSHQGLIHITSKLGEGSSMRILFPIRNQPSQYQVNVLLQDIAKRSKTTSLSTQNMPEPM